MTDTTAGHTIELVETARERNDNPAMQGLLEEAIRRLVAAFDPERIVLFGSRARGEADAASDIDLLIVAETEEPVHARMGKAQRALRGLPVAADVFVCTPREAATYAGWLSHTVAVALREGRTVHARP